MYNSFFRSKIRRMERFLKDNPEPAAPPKTPENQNIWYSYKIDPVTHELIYSEKE